MIEYGKHIWIGGVRKTPNYADARQAAKIKLDQLERELREYLKRHPEEKIDDD